MKHRDSESFGYGPEVRGFWEALRAKQGSRPPCAGRKHRVTAWRHASRALPLVLMLCSFTCANASMIIGNLGGGNNGTNSFSSSTGWANSFTMGGSNYSLTDIQIVLAGMPALSNPVFELESDNGAPSDTVLLTLVNPGFGTGIQIYTFTPGSPFTLAANTTYWLTATSPSSTPSHWEDSIGDQIPVGAGATYGLRDESPDGGVTWGGAAGNTDLFEVDGTVLPAGTPEPGSAGLAAIGLSLFFLATGWKTLALRRLRIHAASAQ